MQQLKTLFASLLICFGLAHFSNAAEGDFIENYTTNVQLLRGYDYKLGSKERTIMTIEHANSWKYGDFHFFYDQTWPDVGTSFYYVEPTLRFSLSKISGTDLSYGIIKDVLISSNFEFTKGHDTRKLGGISVDLNVPGFKFFKVNMWLRDNPELSGSTYQYTICWNRPIEAYGAKFLIEGFADLAGSEGTTVAHQLVVPRFLLDVGDLAGYPENHMWFGIEYQYWHNKAGRKNVTESVPQLQAKWVF